MQPGHSYLQIHVYLLFRKFKLILDKRGLRMCVVHGCKALNLMVLEILYYAILCGQSSSENARRSYSSTKLSIYTHNFFQPFH